MPTASAVAHHDGVRILGPRVSAKPCDETGPCTLALTLGITRVTSKAGVRAHGRRRCRPTGSRFDAVAGLGTRSRPAPPAGDTDPAACLPTARFHRHRKPQPVGACRDAPRTASTFRMSKKASPFLKQLTCADGVQIAGGSGAPSGGKISIRRRTRVMLDRVVGLGEAQSCQPAAQIGPGRRSQDPRRAQPLPAPARL